MLAGAALLGVFASTNTAGTRKAYAWGAWPRTKKPGSGFGGGGGHCYLKATMIATPKGERRIEDLEIGDLVMTVLGTPKPVKWIGRWKAEKVDNQAWDWSDLPVKVARGALDGSLPRRDLYVTEMHCLFIDGILIPAIDLVNGVSIKKELPSTTDALEYFHIELEDHDVVIANGAASETLRVEAGDRQHFDNADEYLRLYGSEPETMLACAPFCANNTRLKALQSRIRTTVAPLYDIRQPHEVVQARLADQAMRKAA